MKDRWTGLDPDQRPFRQAASFYAEYRYRPSDEFVRLLASHLEWSRDDRVLDLGAGPAHVSMLIAPYVEEVVVMEPEEAMLDEGRKRADRAGLANLSFVLGGSEDLSRLNPSLGDFATVVISQAFHWMRDQDAVLRSLGEMLDTRRGAVALIGYVNEPDYNRVSVGLDREPWKTVEEILERHLAGVPERPSPRGRHDPFPEILERSAFSRVELLSYEHEMEVRPSIESAIGALYTLGSTLDRLGERRSAFEAEVREALAGADTTPFRARLVDSALIGRRPQRLVGPRDATVSLPPLFRDISDRMRRYGDSVSPLDGLNSEQRRAAETVRGPVCILAGAGTGKTTTITRRIAQQVASGAFDPAQIMAVTFTDKAGGELRARLVELGVTRVRAGTFHSAALRQLRHFAPDTVGRILPSKALLLRQIGNRLPAPYKFRPAGDLAAEVEWAKNRRIGGECYLDAAEDREPPIPAELMARVYLDYERRKKAEGLVDFEDLLERAVRVFEDDERAATTFRAQYRAFTVDEYQDVNLLQQSLLELWLGDGNDLCVVGDDYQSIYAFTGAGPEHLLGLPARFPDATVVRLEENYRSTPQVLALANRLVPRLGGAEKVLRPTRPAGDEPVVAAFTSPAAEAAAIVAAIRAAEVPLEEIAILCRTNARLTDFEEALHEAEIPFQGSSLLGRDAARRLVRRLERSDRGASDAVRAAALEAGWLEELPDKLGERELVRQTDLARLVALADAFEGDAAAFVADLRRRFDAGGEGARGVNLLTLHKAKGLEFDTVFIPRLEEKELPSRQARTSDELDEERRLLYVGMTRAKRVLWLTWSAKRSRFVAELGHARTPDPPRTAREWTPAAERLRAWRLSRAREDGVPPYVVFHDTVLHAIADAQPTSLGDLSQIAGVGPAKLERYGEAVLSLLRPPRGARSPQLADGR